MIFFIYFLFFSTVLKKYLGGYFIPFETEYVCLTAATSALAHKIIYFVTFVPKKTHAYLHTMYYVSLTPSKENT